MARSLKVFSNLLSRSRPTSIEVSVPREEAIQSENSSADDIKRVELKESDIVIESHLAAINFVNGDEINFFASLGFQTDNNRLIIEGDFNSKDEVIDVINSILGESNTNTRYSLVVEQSGLKLDVTELNSTLTGAFLIREVLTPNQFGELNEDSELKDALIGFSYLIDIINSLFNSGITFLGEEFSIKLENLFQTSNNINQIITEGFVRSGVFTFIIERLSLFERINARSSSEYSDIAMYLIEFMGRIFGPQTGGDIKFKFLKSLKDKKISGIRGLVEIIRGEFYSKEEDILSEDVVNIIKNQQVDLVCFDLTKKSYSDLLPALVPSEFIPSHLEIVNERYARKVAGGYKNKYGIEVDRDTGSIPTLVDLYFSGDRVVMNRIYGYGNDPLGRKGLAGVLADLRSHPNNVLRDIDNLLNQGVIKQTDLIQILQNYVGTYLDTNPHLQFIRDSLMKPEFISQEIQNLDDNNKKKFITVVISRLIYDVITRRQLSDKIAREIDDELNPLNEGMLSELPEELTRLIDTESRDSNNPTRIKRFFRRDQNIGGIEKRFDASRLTEFQRRNFHVWKEVYGIYVDLLEEYKRIIGLGANFTGDFDNLEDIKTSIKNKFGVRLRSIGMYSQRYKLNINIASVIKDFHELIDDLDYDEVRREIERYRKKVLIIKAIVPQEFKIDVIEEKSEKGLQDISKNFLELENELKNGNFNLTDEDIKSNYGFPAFRLMLINKIHAYIKAKKNETILDLDSQYIDLETQINVSNLGNLSAAMLDLYNRGLNMSAAAKRNMYFFIKAYINIMGRLPKLRDISEEAHNYLITTLSINRFDITSVGESNMVYIREIYQAHIASMLESNDMRELLKKMKNGEVTDVKYGLKIPLVIFAVGTILLLGSSISPDLNQLYAKINESLLSGNMGEFQIQDQFNALLNQSRLLHLGGGIAAMLGGVTGAFKGFRRTKVQEYIEKKKKLREDVNDFEAYRILSQESGASVLANRYARLGKIGREEIPRLERDLKSIEQIYNRIKTRGKLNNEYISIDRLRESIRRELSLMYEDVSESINKDNSTANSTRINLAIENYMINIRRLILGQLSLISLEAKKVQQGRNKDKDIVEPLLNLMKQYKS